MKDITRRTIIEFTQLIIGMGVLLFLPAWTFDFWQAWLYLFVFAISIILIIVYLWKRDLNLLERRLNVGPGAEKEKSQKIIMRLASIGFISLLIIPSIDHRFRWSIVSFYIVIFGDVLIMLGYLIIFFTFKENTFTAATIEVVKDQKVISTGPYALVRHPMYMGGIILLFGIPLALGSWWGLLVFISLVPILIWRLLDEEKFLVKNLSGYSEYKNRVKYRLLPFVW